MGFYRHKRVPAGKQVLIFVGSGSSGRMEGLLEAMQVTKAPNTSHSRPHHLRNYHYPEPCHQCRSLQLCQPRVYTLNPCRELTDDEIQ